MERPRFALSLFLMAMAGLVMFDRFSPMPRGVASDLAKTASDRTLSSKASAAPGDFTWFECSTGPGCDGGPSMPNVASAAASLDLPDEEDAAFDCVPVFCDDPYDDAGSIYGALDAALQITALFRLLTDDFSLSYAAIDDDRGLMVGFEYGSIVAEETANAGQATEAATAQTIAPQQLADEITKSAAEIALEWRAMPGISWIDACDLQQSACTREDGVLSQDDLLINEALDAESIITDGLSEAKIAGKTANESARSCESEPCLATGCAAACDAEVDETSVGDLSDLVESAHCGEIDVAAEINGPNQGLEPADAGAGWPAYESLADGTWQADWLDQLSAARWGITENDIACGDAELYDESLGSDDCDDLNKVASRGCPFLTGETPPATSDKTALPRDDGEVSAANSDPRWGGIRHQTERSDFGWYYKQRQLDNPPAQGPIEESADEEVDPASAVRLSRALGETLRRATKVLGALSARFDQVTEQAVREIARRQNQSARLPKPRGEHRDVKSSTIHYVEI